MKRIWRNNGLTIVLMGFFLGVLCIGQFTTGRRQYNETRGEHGREPVSAMGYLESPHFWEATMENWESEFFQMFVYITLTAFLFQKGSAESNDPDQGREAEHPVTPDSPWAARRGGWMRLLYSHSLSLAFLVLFTGSFLLHARSGARLLNEEQLGQGKPVLTTWDYMGTSRFWFESFQNWQSEFLAIGMMVVLSIFLRERGSPESKPVNAGHRAHKG